MGGFFKKNQKNNISIYSIWKANLNQGSLPWNYALHSFQRLLKCHNVTVPMLQGGQSPLVGSDTQSHYTAIAYCVPYPG